MQVLELAHLVRPPPERPLELALELELEEQCPVRDVQLHSLRRPVAQRDLQELLALV